MNKSSVIIVILAIAIAAMFATGIYNPYKRAFQQQLENQRKESQAKIDSLSSYITVLDVQNELLQAKADSALAALDSEEEKRKQERDAFNRKMAQLSKLSTAELASYFTERYGN